MLAGLLDDFKDALVSGCSGTSRPANLLAGGMWIDTSLQAAPNYYWTLKIYDGTSDIEVFRVSVLTGASGFTMASDEFTIRKISADTAAAILNLIKNRIANTGQVLNGDTIAEIRFTGRTNTSTDPIVAYLKVNASEDETSSEFGVTLSFNSTAVGTSQLLEHLRFITEIVEFVLPHKINSTILVSDNIATALSLLITGDKILSELTGSITSNIHGIEVAETSIKYIHNRSTAEVTLKHESVSASATERLKLPESEDLVLLPECSAVFFYCTTDSRWKYLFGYPTRVRTFIYNFAEGYSEWIAPFTGNARISAFQEPTEGLSDASDSSSFSRAALNNLLSWGDNTHGQLGTGDALHKSVPTLVVGGIQFKDAMISGGSSCGITDREISYAWGRNQHGQLGLGDVVPRSSPVAVLGGLKFTRMDIGESSYALQYSGAAYAFGRNQHGQLGLGDVVPRSSPVAVLGGLKFASLFHGADAEGSTFGVARDTGILYAWGQNTQGRLGVGDISSRSSPVAVLGGLKFKKVVLGANSTVGLTESGVAYAWGSNADGELGVGNVVSRSSPVAVLGGLTFSNIFSLLTGAGNSFFGLTDDGVLYAWGYNIHGQLGLGDVVPRSSPVAVLGGLKFSKIARLSASSPSIVAVEKGTGSLYAWGQNVSGQLGLNDVVPRSSPVAVLGGLEFASVAMGDEYIYGQASDGVFYAWGYNALGQLGDNSITSRSSPVAVQGIAEILFEVPTVKVVPVVLGTTYKIKLCGGISFFDSTPIGKNIRRATVAFEN